VGPSSPRTDSAWLQQSREREIRAAGVHKLDHARAAQADPEDGRPTRFHVINVVHDVSLGRQVQQVHGCLDRESGVVAVCQIEEAI
jgi:hypothetical protein